MSTAGGGKKGGPKGSKKASASDEASDRATPASLKSGTGAGAGTSDPDTKEDATVDSGDKKEGKGEDTTPKPVSAGQTQRDAGTKAMNLALKQEWTPLEQTLKSMEKFVAAGGEDVNSHPLAGVMDPVSEEAMCDWKVITSN